MVYIRMTSSDLRDHALPFPGLLLAYISLRLGGAICWTTMSCTLHLATTFKYVSPLPFPCLFPAPLEFMVLVLLLLQQGLSSHLVLYLTY